MIDAVRVVNPGGAAPADGSNRLASSVPSVEWLTEATESGMTNQNRLSTLASLDR
jgi:hypothetical protein